MVLSFLLPAIPRALTPVIPSAARDRVVIVTRFCLRQNALGDLVASLLGMTGKTARDDSGVTEA